MVIQKASQEGLDAEGGKGCSSSFKGFCRICVFAKMQDESEREFCMVAVKN